MIRSLIISLLLTLGGGTGIYSFKVPALNGGTINLSKYKGEKILIVNTASKCGNTPQYADLEKLYNTYKGKLVIIGFPANNFGQQEPGTNKEISAFCTKQYHITFPMAQKISVLGADTYPLYKWLEADAQKKGLSPALPQWNFQKYLLDEKGNLVAVFNPKTKPFDPTIIAAIEKQY
ncbi:MAG TPA: glutathione peroxidase [Chitinophagaceae bacterium]|nr:glutathione peroxidase [Chitinophagaceae bacterium]